MVIRIAAFACLICILFCGCFSADLQTELKSASIDRGYALAASTAGQIQLITFDDGTWFLESKYRFPKVVFGKSGRFVAWVNRFAPFDRYDDFILDTTSGANVTKRQLSISGFSPIALDEKTKSVAFIGTPNGTTVTGLYWAPLDFASTHFIASQVAWADWSPEHHLLFEQAQQIFEYDPNVQHSRLVVDGRLPTSAPNGQWIAFIRSDRRAALISKNGKIVASPLNDFTPSSSLQWSPDSKYVSFTERLPSWQNLLDRAYRLIVYRIDDKRVATVSILDVTAINYESFRWIVDYRHFCPECTRSR